MAAAANFSKESYDVFREEMRNKGAMEYYLWGRAELEDMLHLPKNDRILFTFFGISLASRRRSKFSEIKSLISVKNKLFRILGEGDNFYKEVLLRDLKDTKYPYKKEYKDFETRPRWKKYTAFNHHPLGVFCHIHEHFAFIDIENKQWDYFDAFDLCRDDHEDAGERKRRSEAHDKIFNIWESLPRKNKGHIYFDGLVKYADIGAVDEKGDYLYNFPHLYVDFDSKKGPFARFIEILKIGEKEIISDDDFKRKNIFSEELAKTNKGKVHKKRKIVFNSESYKEFKEYRLETIFEADGRYSFLNPGDIIEIENREEATNKSYIKITYKTRMKVGEYLENLPDAGRVRMIIKPQLGCDCSMEEKLNIYEFVRWYSPQSLINRNNSNKA